MALKWRSEGAAVAAGIGVSLFVLGFVILLTYPAPSVMRLGAAMAIIGLFLFLFGARKA